MIVLGVNGWRDISHDAAAALVIDGRLHGFIEEERLSRIRYSPEGSPSAAASALLAQAKLSIQDVDVVAMGWNLPGYYGSRPSGWRISDLAFVQETLGRNVSRAPRVEFHEHHRAHAASALVQSGFDDAAVLVIDGQGDEKDSISIFQGRDGRVRLVHRWSAAHSLGWLYEAATVHCGFQSYNAGKTMGLAAYGRAAFDFEAVSWRDGDVVTCIPCDTDEDDVAIAFGELISRRFGPQFVGPRGSLVHPCTLRSPAYEDDPASHNPDVAATAQQIIEKVVRSLAARALDVTGSRRLCLTGGVALNCVANGKILDVADRLFVQPFANDASVALGAAALSSAAAGQALVGPFDTYLGPEFASEDIERFLSSVGIPFRCVDDPAEAAAQLLSRGAVIGWFQGRMEAGPRALGGRSILALPRPASMRDRVNKIKGRERWRPLAPSLLREEMKRFFGIDVDAPYMLLSFPMTDEGATLAPALVHVDGSARPQSVGPSTRPFRRLLERVKELTDVGLVLNTSFNGPDEPLVCTPEHAVRTFYSLPLDALVMENCVIEKRP